MTLLLGPNVAKHLSNLDEEAGRKFMLRFTKPEPNDPVSKFARKIIEEAQESPIDAEAILRVGDQLKGASVTFTPAGGSPITIKAKSFSVDPAVERRLDEATDAELAEAGRKIVDRMEQDVLEKLVFDQPTESTVAVQWEPELTLERLQEMVAKLPKMAVGIVCRPDVAAEYREKLTIKGADAPSPFTSIPVYEKWNQVEEARVFYDRAKLNEYLKE